MEDLIFAFARCAGRMRLIATIDEPMVIQRILADLGLPRTRAGQRSRAFGAAGQAEKPTLPGATV